MKRKTHPYADLFPMMTAVELDALTEDIRDNKLQQPIVLYQGAVLDGRNRLLACEKAGVEPQFKEHEGDDASALALVISLNAQRRDLTAAQRAIVAARVVEQMPERRGGDQKGKSSPIGRSAGLVAAQFKVSDKSVQQAKAVLADAPDLASQVEACTLSLASAYEQTQGRRKHQEQKRKDADRVAEYRDAISSGETTLERALQDIMERERQERERVTHDAQARQLWLSKLAELVGWIKASVQPRTDEHLTWYTEAGAPGSDHTLTADDIAAAIAQLERVRIRTFGENHVQTRSTKARPRTA